MESITDTLPDGRTLKGLIALPLRPSSSINAPHFPLLVCVHGGTYTADYFNASPSTSIASVSNPLSVPVISISRPGYGGSDSLPPLPAPSTGITYIQEQGKHLHEVTLPYLWKRYGISSGANSIVLLSHSIGSAISIVASALHAEDAARPKGAAYPLAGLITSAIGPGSAGPTDYDPDSPPPEENQVYPNEVKTNMMMGKELGLSPPESIAVSEQMNHSLHAGEAMDIGTLWGTYWRRYSEAVTVPLLYGLEEIEAMFNASEKEVTEYAAAFPNCVRREASMVPKAPHCIELSYAGRGWLTRCVGFGIECAVWWALRDVRVEDSPMLANAASGRHSPPASGSPTRKSIPNGVNGTNGLDGVNGTNQI